MGAQPRSGSKHKPSISSPISYLLEVLGVLRISFISFYDDDLYQDICLPCSRTKYYERRTKVNFLGAETRKSPILTCAMLQSAKMPHQECLGCSPLSRGLKQDHQKELETYPDRVLIVGEKPSQQSVKLLFAAIPSVDDLRCGSWHRHVFGGLR